MRSQAIDSTFRSALKNIFESRKIDQKVGLLSLKMSPHKILLQGKVPQWATLDTALYLLTNWPQQRDILRRKYTHVVIIVLH